MKGGTTAKVTRFGEKFKRFQKKKQALHLLKTANYKIPSLALGFIKELVLTKGTHPNLKKISFT